MKNNNKGTFNSSINTMQKKSTKKPFCFGFNFCKGDEDLNNIDNLEPEIKKTRSFGQEDPQIPRHYSSVFNRIDIFKDKIHENLSKNRSYPLKNDKIQESLCRTDVNLLKNGKNLMNNHGNPLKKDLFLLKNNQRMIIAKIAVKNFKLKKDYSCESSLIPTLNLDERLESSLIPRKNHIIQQEIMKNLASRLKKTCKIVLFPHSLDSISLISVLFFNKYSLFTIYNKISV